MPAASLTGRHGLDHAAASSLSKSSCCCSFCGGGGAIPVEDKFRKGSHQSRGHVRQREAAGERRRLPVLAVLAKAPDALLLDEPFSSLDEATKDDMRSFTAAQIKRHALPTLLVTHDPRDADCLGADTLHISGAAIAKTGSLPATAK